MPLLAATPIDDLRARMIRDEDFDRFDLILAADAQNIADLKAQLAANEKGVVMTSPSIRSDWRAVIRAIVPLVKREICLSPRCSQRARSSSNRYQPHRLIGQFH